MDHGIKAYTRQGRRVAKRLSAKKIQIPDDSRRGEFHGLLQLPGGKFARARYMGPGTLIRERLEQKEKPISPVDKLARNHDIRYALATHPRDIDQADVRFMDGLKRLEGKVPKFNIDQGKLMVPKNAVKRITGKSIFYHLTGERDAEKRHWLKTHIDRTA